MNACCLFSLKYCAWLDGKQGFHLMINVRVLAFVFSSWCEQNRLSRVLGEMANFRGADTHGMHEILVSILCLGDKGLNALFSVLSESTHQQLSPGQFFCALLLTKSIQGPRNLFRQTLVDIRITLWNVLVWRNLVFYNTCFLKRVFHLNHQFWALIVVESQLPPRSSLTQVALGIGDDARDLKQYSSENRDSHFSAPTGVAPMPPSDYDQAQNLKLLMAKRKGTG